MVIPDNFPRRMSRAMPAAAAPADSTADDGTAGEPGVVAAPGSWPWRRATLLASVAAQMITIGALESADPIPASWTALLLGVAPALLALVCGVRPGPGGQAGRAAGRSGAGDGHDRPGHAHGGILPSGAGRHDRAALRLGAREPGMTRQVTRPGPGDGAGRGGGTAGADRGPHPAPGNLPNTDAALALILVASRWPRPGTGPAGCWPRSRRRRGSTSSSPCRTSGSPSPGTPTSRPPC